MFKKGVCFMSCYHPLKGFVYGVRPDNGKKIIKILKSDNLDFVNKNDYVDVIEIPCGHCIGCRLDYSREWANRCMLELKNHDKACFITLTYNDEHLPIRNEIVDSDGCITTSPIHSLSKSDLQKFFKRLRKTFSSVRIRYFASGEYGSTTYRPHYHAILFGVDFSDDRVLRYSKDGFNYYTSSTLDRLWSVKNVETGEFEKIGHCLISDCNWNTCAYCARYIVKKSYGNDADRYEKLGISPEFATMSRRPGLGREFFDMNKDKIYLNDEIFLSSDVGGKKIKPPKYYDRCLENIDPDLMELIRLQRDDIAVTNKILQSENTSESYIDFLLSSEYNKIDKVKSLKRDF